MEERVKLSFWIDKNLFEELYRIKAEKKLRAYTHIMIEATKYVLNKYKKGELEIEKVKNGVRIIEVGKESEETLEEVEEIETMEESKEEEGTEEEAKEEAEEEEAIISDDYSTEAYEEGKKVVLKILREKGKVSLSQLKEKFGKDDGWVSWLVSNMELDDLVEINGNVVVLREEFYNPELAKKYVEREDLTIR